MESWSGTASRTVCTSRGMAICTSIMLLQALKLSLASRQKLMIVHNAKAKAEGGKSAPGRHHCLCPLQSPCAFRP